MAPRRPPLPASITFEVGETGEGLSRTIHAADEAGRPFFFRKWRNGTRLRPGDVCLCRRRTASAEVAEVGMVLLSPCKQNQRRLPPGLPAGIPGLGAVVLRPLR